MIISEEDREKIEKWLSEAENPKQNNKLIS